MKCAVCGGPILPYPPAPVKGWYHTTFAVDGVKSHNAIPLLPAEGS